jgi:hypothetical protein
MKKTIISSVYELRYEPSRSGEVYKNFALLAETLNSLIPTKWDYFENTYTGANLTKTVFKLGGSAGTIVSTIDITYDGSDNIITATRS